ncbi:type 1 glutamine amidotransferase [Sphingosinicella humi]|uniref:GMP synthase n=1 Tax=Allosphingosinicella humi TaxID=2068657 RepID=A0A2U2IYJ7_9SPHN|nr:GMP synthase [Sphingosinicella humi]PWG01128.1 GMP synthase [Sphingosinicella humi]
MPSTKIGILETGGPPRELAERFGDYAAMMRRMLGEGYAYATYDVADALPATPEEQDAYIVTGSPAGVYEDHAWIEQLIGWLRQAKGRAKLVGICFGHQVMAEAFGGRVAQSDKGWGIGLHRYQLHERTEWMDHAAAIAIPVSHQDQIVELPPFSRIVGGSDFCRVGILAYEDQPAISFQCHPEFEPAFAKALIEARRDRLPDPDAAIASLDQPDDRERVAGWIRRFLDGLAAERS